MTIHFGDGSSLTAAPSGGANGQQIVRSFGSSTTYTPTSGTKSISVYCVGAGGGAGKAEGDTSGESNFYDSASGAGGGGTALGYYNITGSFSAAITVGGGGFGGSGHNNNQMNGGEGGESKLLPSGSYSGNGTLAVNGAG